MTGSICGSLSSSGAHYHCHTAPIRVPRFPEQLPRAPRKVALRRIWAVWGFPRNSRQPHRLAVESGGGISFRIRVLTGGRARVEVARDDGADSRRSAMATRMPAPEAEGNRSIVSKIKVVSLGYLFTSGSACPASAESSLARRRCGDPPSKSSTQLASPLCRRELGLDSKPTSGRGRV